jgi:MFS family permease
VAAGAGKTRPRVGPWRILAVALVSQTGISVVDQGIPSLTGFIKADLGISAAAAGLAVSAFTFGRIFGAYAAGEAADRIGERRVLIFGSLATGALVGIGASLPLAALFPVLVLGGVASAASTPAGGRLVLVAFPREQRGLALGLRQTGIPIGGLIAAALLPWIAHEWGWRWSLAIAGAIAAVAVLPLVLAAVERVELPHVREERRLTTNPARNRNIWLLTAWGCLVVSGQYALLAFLALDLHQSAGLRLATGSLLVAVAQAAGIVGRVAWGAVSDRALRYGRKPLLLVLTVVGLIGTLALLGTPRSAPVTAFIPVAALAGLALIGYQGLMVTMVAEAAGPQRAGAATGFSVTFVAASIAISPSLYGLVADLTGSYRAIWAALACVLVVAFVPALLVREG